MDFLYTLYDVLVSINIPSDKARAVVDAMERDMTTTLATKQDIQAFAQATSHDLQLLRQDMDGRFALMAHEFHTLRSDVTRDIEGMRAAMTRGLEGLRGDMMAQRTDVTKDVERLRLSIIVQVGGMFFIGLGLLFAAIKLV